MFYFDIFLDEPAEKYLKYWQTMCTSEWLVSSEEIPNLVGDSKLFLQYFSELTRPCNSFPNAFLFLNSRDEKNKNKKC